MVRAGFAKQCHKTVGTKHTYKQHTLVPAFVLRLWDSIVFVFFVYVQESSGDVTVCAFYSNCQEHPPIIMTA